MRHTFSYILLIFFLFNSTILSAAAQDEDINNQLISLSAFGQGKDVKHLLDNGADPNVRNSIGQPVIVLAAGRSDKEAVIIVKALTDAGADITAFDEQGDNALIAATRKGTIETVQHLLTFLPAMKTLDAEGNSLITIAENRDNYEILYAIEEADKAEDERLKELQGEEMLSKLMKDYGYYYCAHGYLEFYVGVGDAKDTDKEKFENTLAALKEKAESVGNLLKTYFEYNEEMLSEMRLKSKLAIERELSNYPDINYRKIAGVGTDEHLNKRCEKVAQRWKTKTEKIKSDDDDDFETPWY